LNLIEHERRRIGGALLRRIAEALEMDPDLLSEGAETTLTTALGSAADTLPEANAEVDRLDEFAARFPGWAQVIESQYTELGRLQRLVAELSDRLTYDPFLSASMHELLSSVTAVRSASAILTDGGEISPEWQARFHRNIYEDAQRLATSTESLVQYLDAGSNPSGLSSLPQDEVEGWLSQNGWQVPGLEETPTLANEEIQGLADLGAPAQGLALAYVDQYRKDAERLPLAILKDVLHISSDPLDLAARFGVDLPTMFRRLAALAPADLPGGQPFGLVACDASGTMIFRKPIQGFDVPQYGAACSLWPLFHAIQRPMMPIRQDLRTMAREEFTFETFAIAEVTYPEGYGLPPMITSWMLIAPAQSPPETSLNVGMSCRICTVEQCAARREPSIVGKAKTATEDMAARL
jgi:hypothetical protein